MRDVDESQRLLTFRSGGWVILLTIVFAIGVMAVVLVPALRFAKNRPPGDFKDPSTYGFDLSASLVPVQEIKCGQRHRDAVGSLDHPPAISLDGVIAFNEEVRGKYIVSDDLVVGVSLGGETRAYPMRVLAFHEVVNDTLGGVPIAVTYSPPSDSVVVVSRDAGGETRDFGLSGLIYNANHLLYDRREGGGESLWSPIMREAIAGPAQGEALQLVPAELTTWATWSAAHPETTVPGVSEAQLKRYKELSYAPYIKSDRLLFPVDPEPPADGPAAKAPCIVVFAGGRARAYPLAEIARRADGDGRWRDEIADATVDFHVTVDPLTVTATTGDTLVPVPSLYTFWCAWHATEPGTELVDAEDAS